MTLKNRLSFAFSKARAESRSAFVGYLMAGDPDLEKTLDAMHDLVSSGVDIIELGFPFTDPMADGPIIQRANLRVLDKKIKLSDVFALLSQFRQTDNNTPVILMGYANPAFSMGYETFADQLSAAGGDGAILVDIPLEESAQIEGIFADRGLSYIRMATPTSDPARLMKIGQGASGFIYFVAVAGVTGSKSAEFETLTAQVEHLRFISGKPICLGFGIKSPEDVNRAARVADGVVVGSAIVTFAEKMAIEPEKYDEIRQIRSVFVEELARGLKLN